MHQNATFKYSLLKEYDEDQCEMEPLRINVYTSEHCSYCNEALEIARSAANQISCNGNAVEVVETSIDNIPSVVEDLDIVALPMILIGRVRLIGLPSPEDVERFIHETILMGY